MLATRSDETVARRCACQAMSGPAWNVLPMGEDPAPASEFNWDKFSTNMNTLLNTYGSTDAARRQAQAAEAEAGRQEQIALASRQAADAKRAAAEAQSGVAPAPTGMSTGVKVAIGAGVLATAVVAYKVLS